MADTPKHSLGAKIRRARLRAIMTLDELSQQAGMSKAYLSLIETGRVANPPSDEKLRRIEQVLKFPANELVSQAHLQRTPRDVRAMLQQLIRQRSGMTGTGDDTTVGPAVVGGAVVGGSGPEGHASGGMGHATGSDAIGRRPSRQPSADPPSSEKPSVGVTAGGGDRPLNLDDAYLRGVLQELADRNTTNIEPFPGWGDGRRGGHPPGNDRRANDRGAAARHAGSPLTMAPIGVGSAVPVVNRVSAGYPSDFTDLSYPPRNADAYITAPGVDDPDAFAARVSGDSMSPKYAEGDIVIFSPAAAWRDGADCFVRFDDGQTTFKRVYSQTDEDGREFLRLDPRNPRYPQRTVPREQVEGVYRAVFCYRSVGDE